MSEAPGLLVFLDTNVLAKPVTRSLLLFAASASGYSVTWSAFVENEADRHRRDGQVSVAQVRQSAGLELSASSDRSDTFVGTSVKDRPVLADAVGVGATLIITEDVDDFGETDLTAAVTSAVNPDLFLAERVTTDAFREAVTRMAAPMAHPPRTPEQLFIQLGRQHPLATDAHKTAFDAAPMPATHHPPAVLFRGHLCLRCLRICDDLVTGVCGDCRSA